MMYGNDDSPYSSDEDEEFCCPLCIEEMDLSDRSFKPCPCGYQICQFCYNNIRENPELNGKCPACRRLYDDESVVYTPISSEEIKRHQIKQANREKEKKQKERERKDTHESSSINASSISNTSSTTARKHLSGVRVIQKNLVYVIGFNPNVPTDDLAQLLKGDEYFGQYGKIQKIVINKRTNANGVPGVGVYVTYSRKDEAAKCIAAVDGTIVDGKYLRAAYGTTKYCSYYLRNQSCPNPNCMFLHEPGEEADSYSRQDLSTYQNRQQQHSSTALGSFTTSSNVSASSQGFRTHQISSPSTSSANLFTNPYSHVTGVSHQSSHFNSHSSSPVVSQAKLSSSPAISSASLHSDFDHHSPALPATAAWASKPSPQVSHAKISLNNSSPHGTPVARPKISTPIQTESRTPSPAQTSLPEVQQINSVIRKSQSPETTAPASSEKLALSQSQASLSTELKGSSLKVVKITKTSVSEPAHLLASDSSATPVSTPVPVILPSPRKLIPDPVAELLDNTVKIFCKYFEKDTPARFNFHEEQIRDDENTGDNQNFTSLPPLFSFGRFNDNFDLGEETENEWAFSSSKFVNMMNPRKIQPQISFTVLENFQQISDAKYREGRLDATPPGLLNTSTTSTSSSNSQELLARLMKGSSAKDSIPLSTNNDGQVKSRASNRGKEDPYAKASNEARENEENDNGNDKSKWKHAMETEYTNIIFDGQSRKTYKKPDIPMPISMDLPSHIDLPGHGPYLKSEDNRNSDFSEKIGKNEKLLEKGNNANLQELPKIGLSPKITALGLKNDFSTETPKEVLNNPDLPKSKLNSSLSQPELPLQPSSVSISPTPSHIASPQPSLNFSQPLLSPSTPGNSEVTNSPTMPVKIDESLNNSLPLTSELQLGNEKGEGKKLKKSNLQPLQDAEHIANSGLRVLRVDSTPTSFQHSILAKAVLPRTLKKQASLMALDPLKEQKESLTSVETLDDIISSNNVDDNCTGYVEMSTMSKRERRKYEKEKKKQEAQRLKCEEEKLHEEEIRREKERQRLMEEWKRDNQKDEVSDNADHVDDFFHAETSKSQVIDKHDEIPIRGSMNLFQNHIGFSAGFNPSSPAQVHMTKDTPSSFLDNGSRVAMPSREPISRKHLGFTGDSRNTQNTEAGQKFVHVSEKYLQEDRTVKERENTELMLQETNEANKKHQKEKKEDTTRKYQDVERKHEEDASSRHKAEEAEMKCKREAESQDKKNEENMELKRKEKEEAHRRCKEEVEQKEKELLRKNKELEQNKLQDLLKKSKVVELARLEEVRREQEAFKSKRREIAELQKKSEEESRRKEHEEKLKRAAEERKRLKERKKRADEERKRQIEDRTQLEEEKKRQLEEENRKLEKQRAEESRKCLAEEKLLEKEKKRLEEEKLLSDERELAEFGKRNEQKVKESLLEIVNKKSYLSDVLVPHLSDLKVRKTVIDEIVARFRVSNENTLMLVEEFIQDAKITLDPYLYTKGVNMEKFQRNFAAFVSSKIDTSNVPEEIDVKQFINSLGLDLNKYSFFDLSAESTAFPVHNDFSQQELMEEADRIRLLEEAIDDSEMLKRTSNCGICFVGQDGYKPMEHGPYQTNGLSGFAIKEELEEDVKLVITTSVDESEKYLDAVYEEISRLDKKLLKSIKRNRKISMLD